MSTSRRSLRIGGFVAIGVGLLLVGLAAASSVLFTQNFPSVPTAPATSVTSSCSSLQAVGSYVPVGGGPILFNCTYELGAFVVDGAPATVVPTFTLPANATDLYVLPALPEYNGTMIDCAGFSGALEVTSGMSVALPTSGSWDYCVDATGALPAFTVSWSA
jgi:hypothetical protein